MESPDEVRRSLGVAVLADLRHHEETLPEGEARVSGLLAETGNFSWPLVVDRDSGVILDGSHRARVLVREHRARVVPVQWVALDDPGVHVGAWCRVLEGVSPAAFRAACREAGLEPNAPGALACHYGDRVYGGPGLEPVDAYDLARRLERALSGNGHGPRRSFCDDRSATRYVGARDTVVLRLPALGKAAVRERGANGLFPPKSTRFLLPFRLFGLAIPVALLAGRCEALVERLDAQRARPLACLGGGLFVDRPYPERLWQFTDYRIPPALFGDGETVSAYEAALARALSAIP